MQVLSNLVGFGYDAAAYSPGTSWINGGVLAALRDYKNQVDADLAAISRQVVQLLRALPEGIEFQSDFAEAEDVESPPPCTFWPADFSGVPALAYPEFFTVSQYASGEQLYPFPSFRQCPTCKCSGGLIEKETVRESVKYISSWCVICGHVDDADGLLFAITLIRPDVSLADLLASGVSRKALRRVISAAVAVFLSVLKQAAFKPRFVTSQRSFFTVHGAHPPRFEPQCELGLFSERAFQLRVA